MHKTAGIVLLGIGAVVILYLASKSTSLGNYFGLGSASGANPSPLTPRITGYDSTGKPIFTTPTTTPYGAANTGVQSGVVNDTLLAGSLANLGSSILRLFTPSPTAYPPGQSPYNLLGSTPASPPGSTTSAADMGTPTIADQGISVSGSNAPIFGPFPTPVPGTVYGPPIITAGSPIDPITGFPSASPAGVDLSVPNNPLAYVDFGIPTPAPPASPGYVPGGGAGFFANDFSGYNVPNTVVDLTGLAAPPPPPPDPTAVMV